MSNLPDYALANQSTVAGNNMYWQVSYMKEVPPRRKVEQQWMHCPLCTLPYPCQHVDAKQYALNTVQRWESYPLNPSESICVEFESTGFCSSFAARGYCRLRHETEAKIEKLTIPWKRCNVCTLPVKTRCYIHDPPLGRSLCKADRGLVVDGVKVNRRFLVGEIVGVASASAGGYVYSVVIQANRSSSRMYTLATYLHEDGRFSKNTGQKSIGKLHGAQFRGWNKFPSVVKFLQLHSDGKSRTTEKSNNDSDNATNDEWTFDFVETQDHVLDESDTDDD